MEEWNDGKSPSEQGLAFADPAIFGMMERVEEWNDGKSPSEWDLAFADPAILDIWKGWRNGMME